MELHKNRNLFQSRGCGNALSCVAEQLTCVFMFTNFEQLCITPQCKVLGHIVNQASLYKFLQCGTIMISMIQ